MIEIKVWKNVEKNISQIPWPTVVLYNEVIPDRQLITGRSSGLRPRGQTAAQTNARCYMENQNQEQEIREAIQAADYALQCLDRAESHLNSASNWGIIDMLGGGLLTTMVKHSKMDDAAADLNEARDALQRFSRELQDVHSFVDFPFNTADFLSFADFFFDGFIADWLMQDRINTARDQVGEAKQRVNAIRSQLGQMVQ